ncbi:hypothetical protein EKO04_010142 [Ascochyta lentis]|uniref:RanBD1 domain-containing protein n=1 Tax=Ascochyta lentis TaxID=205686 RepID=A0A8H7MEL3_9PLEO|nr:hypothetical protein EKO04_010142 [Ascochyta lentis]
MSGKRANVFGQGRPERPYEDRDEPAEVPQRATAAQLAARKIKSVKPRRAPGAASSGLSQSVSFGGAPQQPNFSFGASAPIGGGGDNNNNNNSNGGSNMFGGGNAFGSGTTNSFPPPQSSSSSNTFTNNSFPAPNFGAGNQNSLFQAPTGGFDFSPASSTNNPFGANNGGAAPTNGTSTSFGGSIFGSQPASNPFGGAQQNNTSSASGSTSMFGTTNGASTPAFTFGGPSSAPAAAPSTPAPASQPTFSFGANNTSTSAAPSTSSFQFGATSSAAPASTCTPAASSTPSFQFGASSAAAPASTSTPAPASTGLFSFGSTQNNATPAATPAFGGFGAGAEPQKGESTPAAATPQKNMFGFGATSTQGAESTPANTTAAPSTGLFSFGGAATPKPTEAATPAPATNMFGGASTPAPAPASNLFSGLQTSTNASKPKFSFGQTQETPKAQEPTPATPSFFNSVKPAEQASSAASETPKNSLFAGLAKPASTPAPDFSSMFGASQNKESAPTESAPKESEKPTSMFQAAPEAPKTNMFSGFSTPQPTKSMDSLQAKAGMFTAQPKASSGFSFQSSKPNGTLEASSPSPAAQEAPAQPSAKEASNPFASLPGASTGSNTSMFNAPKAPTSTTEPPAPALDTVAAPGLPKIGKLSVPKDWIVEDIAVPEHADGLANYVVELSLQLQAMNLRYRNMLSNAALVADWSLLSIWHHQQSRSLKTKIDNAKKQRAAAKGVTGTESALSTKRKVNEESPEAHEQTPAKRSRPAEPTTPTPKPSTAASSPKFNPPATATSNLFSKAIGNKSSTPEKAAPEPPKAAAPSTGFTPSFSASARPSAPKPSSTSGFTPSFSASTGSSAPKASTTSGFVPSFGTSNGTDASKSAPASTGFTPSFGAPKASASTGFTPSFGAPKAASAGGFTPSFGGSSSGGNTDFTAQFAKSAKTYEQLAAERKKKAKDADYDSDDETEEEWSARYDKEEADRLAKEKEAIANAGGFSLPASTNASGATTPTPTAEPAKEAAKPAPSTNLFANLAKPASGASTPSLFTPRAASPAASTTDGRSVFDGPSAAPSPSSNNLFGHLSSGPSSNNQDDSDDEDEHAEDKSQKDQAPGSTGSTSPKRKFGGSETESDDATSKKQATGTRGSLLSRMTRADETDSEAEKENDKPASVFGQTNGTSTPTNKPFAFFNFENAGANTAPPKANTFAGDQTFKVGSPIKFGGAPATEKKKDAPVFQFQPATPSPAEFSTTPAKPPPSGSLFSFGGTGGSSLLAPNFGASAPSSAPSSVFSSRAGTPLSEAEPKTNSAGADDEEDEKHEQVDLSQLTAEETAANDIIFHIDLALAKQQVDQGDGTKKWENFARGPLWILKDKVSGKCFVRIRIPSGATPLNYQILPALRSNVTGSSKKMVQATRPGKDKGLTPVYFAVKSAEVAEEFSRKYNESMPPN